MRSQALYVQLERPMRVTCKQLGLSKKAIVELARQLSLTDGVTAAAVDDGRLLYINIECESQRIFDKTKLEVEDTIRELVAQSKRPARQYDNASMQANAP